jgi:hypothetical protein
MSHLAALNIFLASSLLIATPNALFSEGDQPPKKGWTRVGPLGETPNPVTNACPLSDQQNKGDWTKFEPMSDEFEELDRSKWIVGMSW